MSSQMRNGYGFDLPVPVGQSMAVSSITGTYSATIVAGPGKGTALATDSTGGGTYGPYSGDVVIRLVSGANSLIDYDIAVSPTLTYAGFAREGYSASGDVTSLVDGAGNSYSLHTPSAGYHFHGFAPNQINSDLKFYDYSGALNDGAFQANLGAAAAWANAGFITQKNPDTVSELTLIAIPALSFDYLAGDSLLIFWRGMATPEGSDMPVMGDTPGTAANGIRIVSTSTGKLKLNAYQASGTQSRFGGTSTATAFEASTAHSVAVAINGVAGTHCYWIDGVRDAAYSSGFLTFGSGGIVDTVNASTFKIGGDGGTSGSIQIGVACRTQALAILKGRRGLGTPAIADLDLLVANMHRNPRALVLNSAW